MKRVLTTGLVLVLTLTAGCAARTAAPTPAKTASSVVLEEIPASSETPPEGRAPGIPVSIRRIVAEQKSELSDMSVLAKVVGDAPGRARAQAEVATLTSEFDSIELHLDSADSDRLDETVHKLHVLESKITLLHEALRSANLLAGSPKLVE